MGGDYSRKSFDALRDFAGVLMQQGHPMLDADWNELVAVFERRIRTGAVDIMGRAVVPRETPLGFEIRLEVSDGEPRLGIGRGRMYVDGLLAENHGGIGAANPAVFDRARQFEGREVGVLDELISRESSDFVDYSAQPYLSTLSGFAPQLPDEPGPHLVYLDVWTREVTPLKEPALLEPALGGIDTTTRLQTVWQVKILPDVGEGVNCSTPDDAIPGWAELKAPSAARLSTAAIEFEDPDEPCLIPPGGGYRGLENQLYRVEIHVGGDGLDDVRFKWSRDNASVGARLESIGSGNRIQVRRIGRDSMLRFDIGDWVEVTDNVRELNGLAGDLVRIVDVDEETRTLELSSALSADLIPSGVGDDTLGARRTRVIRWDQRGVVRLADGSEWVDLNDDANGGLIPVPTDGSAVVLESGVTASFGMEPAGGIIRPGDYWCFAARTAGAQLQILDNAPPKGIHHHCARLAVVTFPEGVLDCRRFWPPEYDIEEGCACTVCVTAESHNSGALTIQAAIQQVPAAGGAVCLAAGVYVLGATPVVISGRSGVTLRGQGVGTMLAYAGPGAAIRIQDGVDIRAEDLSIVAVATGPSDYFTSAVHLTHTQFSTLRRIEAMVAGVSDAQTIGIALDGIQLALDLEENVVWARTALGDASPPAEGSPSYLLLSEVRITENLLSGTGAAISFEGESMHLSATRVDGNLLEGGNRGGLLMTGVSAPGAATSVTGNTISYGSGATGISLGLSNVGVQDNEIIGSAEASGAAITLVEGLAAETGMDAQIIGNRIGAASVGLAIDGPIRSLLVKCNVIRDCREGGISMGADATVAKISIDNNVIENIGASFESKEQPVAAIRIVNAQQVQVVGNTLDGIARQTSAVVYCAGVEASGVGALTVRGNAVTNIGPDQAFYPAFALLVRAPYSSIDVANNQISGLFDPSDDNFSRWSGIVIGDDAAKLVPFDLVAANFVASEERYYVLTNHWFLAQTLIQPAQVSVSNNQVTDARAGSNPLVRIAAGQQSISACSFTTNQVRLLTAGNAPALVEIVAPRVVVSNNVVMRQKGEAISIQLPSEESRPTVLGNVTFGEIRVAPGALSPEFAALNVLAP